MLALHVADGDRAYLCLPGLVPSRGCRMPGGNRAGIQQPFIKCANRDFPDAQNSVLSILPLPPTPGPASPVAAPTYPRFDRGRAARAEPPASYAAHATGAHAIVSCRGKVIC